MHVWSINYFIIHICTTICGRLLRYMPKKNIFFCDRNIENGLASTEMWIDLHAYVKCFRARFILSSSWFIAWVTFWYFSLTQHLSLNRNIFYLGNGMWCSVLFNNYFVLFYVCFIVLFSLNVFIQSTRV